LVNLSIALLCGRDLRSERKKYRHAANSEKHGARLIKKAYQRHL
jgi:hypothetical protein